MSAVFTGNGLGLFNTSLDQLGYGLGQGAGVGQGRDNRYVNVATGNLVWQSADEHLVFRGLTIGLARTYNSLGQISDVGADGWITGFERRIALQSGGFNASGSVMRRYTGDGAYQDFVYQSANVYRSTGGDGAHDTLTWTGDSWVYAEGSSRREERYASQADPIAQGRLTHMRDLRSDGTTPASWVVIYDANQRISEIRAEDGTSTGEAMLFGYDAAGRLSSISTREAGVVRHQVAYEYDAQGRLAAVVSDLTVGNTGDNTWSSTAAQNDGRLFRTQYSYEGASLRLAGVTQSDGTKAVFTYYADGRLKSASQGDSGQAITYAYAAGSTTVTDSLGRSWSYGYDQAGRLTSVTAPAIAGQSDVTAYQYDAAGNLTQVKTTGGAGILSQVDYLHDAAGNVTWEWDALGNAVSRSWNSANQLVSVTRYTGIDPDGTGATLPTGGATTRYVYEAQNRLRFAIDALGQVTELTYATAGNGIGQQSSQRIYLGASYGGSYDLAGLEAWATAAQKADSQLSELIYDAWGRLSQRNDYATVDTSGKGVLDARANVERYTYDAQGLLRQQTVLRGASRTADGAAPSGSQQIVYAYDGMGRLLSTTQRQVSSADTDITTLLTTYAYLDSGHQVLVTDDAGQVVVQTRDSAGRLISVSSRGAVAGVVQVRTTTNFYDAAGQLRATEDAAGGRSYLFYDAKGRLEATVDATGAVSRSYYDAAGRVVGTRGYANRVTTTSWLNAGQVVPTQVDALGLTNNALDHVASRTYDIAGRLLTETDGPESSATRVVTTYTYDGKGQLLQTRSTDAAGTAGTARLHRYFYDPAGRQVGSLDAAGYLTELQYDRAGRVVSQTRYATVSPSAHWAAGTLVQLRPASNLAQDQTTRFFHDGRGQVVGQLDAEGYLTEWVLDEAGNSRAERRYATALVWGAADTLTTLRSRAGSFREQRMSYNALGQLATQVNAEGTVTRYSYDDAGRLLKTEVAQGTSEVREGHQRYNVFGELIGELSGEAALQVLTGMTEAQLDAVYAQYGVRHGYDVLGRRIETIDVAGNRSWYFYNAAGQQTFAVRGVADENSLANALGEVTEQRYNAFGQATDAVSYTGRIRLSVAGSRSSVEAALSTLSYVAATDSRRQYTYTNRGQLASSIDAEGGIRQYSYDAFGDLRVEQSWVGTSSATTTQYRYDLRGLQTRVIEAVGSALEREQSVTLDAFGRITTSTDARGSLRTQTYDRLGRQLTSQQVVGSRPESTSISYDAYGRVLSSTDAMGRVTQQVHDDAARSVTITSPEGVVVTTLHNRHGQSIRITDALGYSEYVYNRDGQLTAEQRKTASGAVVTSQSNQYDAARGLLLATVDGSGRRVEFRYDAAGRVLQRIEDPAGMALLTQYAYDGQGRQLSVTDASGRLTEYSYDREGRLVQVARDPAGLKMLTRYAYDVAGRAITLVEGSGSLARTTQYQYDLLGRRIAEVVDPGTGRLNLTTSYAYDAADNLIRRTDANGQVTRFYYDAANRLVYTVNPLGALTKNWYDAAGRVVATRAFLQATDASTLEDASTIAQIDLRLAWNPADKLTYFVFDGDGRVRWTLRANGEVEESSFDAAGRLIANRNYATKFTISTALANKLLAGTVVPGEITATRNDALDQRTYRVLDAAGQPRLLVDGQGNVKQLQYDLAGRLVGTLAYSRPAVLTAELRAQLEAGSATIAGILAVVTADAAKDMVEYRVHDAAGRLRYSIDAIGAVHETLLDGSGKVYGERGYAVPLIVTTALRGKLQAGTATAAEIAALLAPNINDARNTESYSILDAAGQARYTVKIVADIAGARSAYISELRYDTLGRVYESIEREARVGESALTPVIAALRDGSAQISSVSGWIGTTLRRIAWVRDAAGRVRYTATLGANSLWYVSEQRLDAAGQVVADIKYAGPVALGNTRTEATMQAAVTTAGGDAAAQQRITRYVRDAAGQLRYQIDDAGAVVEYRYDGAGRVVETRQYAVLISTNTAATEAAVATAVAAQTGSNVRVSKTAYDAGSQVAKTTDAAGNVEEFAYDGIGRRISYKNKLGNQWTYAYDAAGRLTQEVSPKVVVASAGLDGAVATVSRSITTAIAYDALGNVISRTEDAAGTVSRTTQYQYDNRGNQVRIVFPDAWRINAAGQFEASGQAPSIDVVYDALGRAVVQKDVNGSYSYKVYDSLDRVAFEVDSDGYVTGYTYNAFGEVTQLRRYTKAISTADIAGFVPGKPLLLSDMTATVIVTNTNDRILTTTYDTRGLKATVKQQTITYTQLSGATATASPTTQFTYNGFGELVRTSVLLDEAANLWADSWQYYDDLGRTVLTVDAEGYVTGTRYNAMGEAVEVREYARALSPTAQAALTTETPPANPAAGEAGIGYDRVVAYTYDVMGRKQSETVLRRFDRADGSQGARNVVTQWNYDAAGQMVMVDLDGQQSRTSYDAMGRVSALQEAAQLRLVSNAESQLLGTTAVDLGAQGLYVLSSAYTAMAYDAFGNAVRVIRYANGLQQGQSSPVGDSVNDQVSVTAYDRQGRAVMNRDALGQQVFLQYDASDHVVHSWYTLTGNDGRTTAVHSYYSYDGAGRQLSSRTQRDGAATPDQLEVVRYNAFGEIVAKGNDDAAGATLPATYQYDRAGNLISTNAEGGSVRQYGYNLAGYQVREQHAVYNGTGTTTAATRYITDRLGRTTGMVLPSNTADANQVNYLSQVVDRWGNVLQLVDPRGYQTTNQYNDRNQLVKQVLPLVKVVTNTAAGTWARPELSWSYDELGRLVASRDGNGNITRYEYDGAGKKTKVIDANGNITQTAYDVLGRERFVQNALGYVTFKQYDRLDRVTAHGDYLPNSAGSARTKKVLESYVLNQNGQRLQSTNAANNTYKYDYDSQGQLIRSQTPMGVVMEYAYDLGGRRSLERYALSHANVVDRDGETVRTNEQTWDYDYFGRLIDHNDLSGRDYNYIYDAASGQLIKETNSSGLDRSTTYFANGQVQSVQEVGGGSYNYAYDQAGNRILEQIQVTDSRGKVFNLKTQIVYDSHNRLQRVVQDDVSNNQRVFELSYDYDAAGNRTHVVARSGYGENSLPITVTNAAPEVIGLPPNRTVRTGVESQFRVRLSDLFRDPEGKALSVTAGQVSAGALTALPAWLTYSVDVNSGEAVFQAAAGSSAANNQTFRLRLTANDGSATALVEFNLNVRANTAPELKPGATTTVAIKTGRPWAMEMPVDSYFLDQDVGDSLKLTGSISPAGSGLILDASNPSVLRLSGTAPVTGTYTLTLVATDQLGATRSRTVSLNVAPNAAPTVVAAIPAQETTRGHSFILEKNVAQVFVDSQGDAFSVTASLDNGLPLPPWLNFSFKNDQAVPQLLFNGEVPASIADGTVYTIRLTATDVEGAVSTTTFTLKVFANRAPTVKTTLPSQSLRVYDTVSLKFDIASIFADADGDAMVFDLVHPNGSDKTGWLKLTVDHSTGKFSLTGTATTSGSYSVQIRARDTEGATSVVSMALEIRPETGPVRNPAVPVYDQLVKIGRGFSFVLPSNMFTDAENDPISLSLSVVIPNEYMLDTVPPTPMYEIYYEPLPSWMSFNPTTRVVSGTVPPGTSVHSFMLRVSASSGRLSVSGGDRVGAANNALDSDIKIDVVPFINAAPTYSSGSLPNRAIVHGGAVDLALPANAFIEPDGDALTYTAEVLVGSAWVSLSTLGLAINSSTGRITGTASNLLQTSYSVRIVARDPQGLSATGTFAFTVTNTAPVAATIPAQTFGRNVSSTFSLASYFSDVNGDALTFTAAGLPTGLSISSGGLISGSATAALGAYTVTVTAADGRGGTVSKAFTLIVANSAPTAPAIANQTATAGAAWSFTVPAFTDPNGDALTYTVSGLPSWMSFNATTRVLSGTSTAVGSWTVTVTATDPAGASVSKAFTVTTPNTAPVAGTIPAQSMARNVASSLSVAGYFTDANGDALTFTATGLPAGLAISTAGVISGTPTAALGNVTVTVTAADGRGGTVSKAFTLTIANTAPTAPAIANQTAAVGAAWSFTAPAFSDANGDALTYTISGMPSWMSFNASTRVLSGTPKPVGTWTITLTATDPSGAAVSKAFTVTTPNVAPTAGTVPNQSLARNIAGSISVAAHFADANGDALTFTASGLPTGLSISTAGVISGTPTAALGAYTVTVTAADGRGGTVSKAFTLTVANSAPTAPAIANQTATAGAAWSFTVPAFSDLNGDALTYTVTGLPSWMSFNATTRVLSGTSTAVGSWTVTVTATDPAGASVSKAFTVTTPNVAPVVGTIPAQSMARNVASSLSVAGYFTDANSDALTFTATGLPAGLAISTAGVISGTPTAALGNVTVTVTAADGRGGTVSKAFTLTIANTAPTAPAIANQAAAVGAAWSFTAPAFSDANGDALTYTISGMPSWMSFNASTRVLSGTPKPVGTWTITLTATDPSGAAVSKAFKVTTPNVAPTAGTVPNQSLARNIAGSISVAAHFADANGDALTFTASGLPTGLSISTAGVISGTPTAALGAYTVTVTAADGRGGTVSKAFTLTVANSAPTAPTIANQTATAGAAWSFTVPAFTDPNGDALTYTVTGLPSWMSFNATTRVLSGAAKPAGSWTITVTATDPSNAAISKSFTVTTPNVAPVVAAAIPAQTASRNITWSYQIPAGTFSDINGDTLTYSVTGLPAGITFTPATRTLSGKATVAPGAYTLVVTAADGNGGTRATNLVLNVTNSVPKYAGTLVARTAQNGESVNWVLPAGAFTDPNGDALTYSLMVQRPGYQETYWEPKEAAWMVRWIEPEWITVSSPVINASTGAITGVLPLFYAPVSPVNGTGGGPQPWMAIRITATDSYGASVSGEFSADINVAPKGSSPGNKTIKSNVAWSLTVPAFTDDNNDALTYSISGLPAGLSFNATTRVISGAVATAGAYTITITANDGKGGVGSTSFVLTVQANTAPTAPTIPNQTGTVGTAYSYQIPAFSDADNDVLTYSASGLPAGMSFNASTRTLSGTPTTAATSSIVITATDGRGGSVSKTFSMTVSTAVVPNRAPVVNKQAASPSYHFYSTNRWVVYPEGFTLPADSFKDPDNNPLTYTVIQKPAWLSYSYSASSGHGFSGVYNGSSSYSIHNITIRATDPSGAYVDMTFTVSAEYDYNDPTNPTDPRRVVLSEPQEFVASDELLMVEDLEQPQAGTMAALAAPAANIQESWYSYSKLNQMVVSGGVLENGLVVAKKDYSSYANVYDAAGNAIAQTQWRSNGAGGWRTTITHHSFSLRGELLLTFNEVDLGGTVSPGVIERRTYDDAGRTTQVLRYYTPGQLIHWVDWERTPMRTNVGGMLYSAEQTSYDDDGRVLRKVMRERPSETMSRAPIGSNAEWTFPEWIYLLGLETPASQYSDVSVLTETTMVTYTDGNNGYDEAGRVKTYSYHGKGYIHTYNYAYTGWDSYREQSVTGTSTSNSYKTTTTISTYDNGGRQTELREKTVGVTMDDRVRSFALDGNGQIISRRDGTVTSGNVFQQKNAQGQAATGNVLGYMNQRNVYANGQQVAGLNEGGKIDVLSRLTAFSNSDAGKTQVVVQAGDTLRSVAQRIYGNENLWYIIAEANALSSDGDLVAGASLTVPEVKTSSNDANTFKPYNPGEITGPTTPSLPYIPPPSGGGCGTLGMVIMIVVIIAVTIWTAGTASAAAGSAMTGAAQAGGATAFASTATVTTAAGATTTATLTTAGAVTAGAVGGAVGAAAGMAVGTALGSMMGVASFSWRGVASAAVTGAITGGFGTYANAVQIPEAARAISGAVAGTGGVYTGQKVAGLDASFSWRSVAISAVANGLAGRVAPNVAKGLDVRSKFGLDLTYGLVGGGISSGLRAMDGDTLHKSDYLHVMADAFGNALGSKLHRDSQGLPVAAQNSRSINAELQSQSEAELIDKIDTRLAADVGLMAVSGRTGNDYKQDQAELRDLLATVAADPEGMTPGLERRFRELSGIAAYEARNIELTDAQVNMNTWMGHIKLLPKVAGIYASELSVPTLGATRAEIAEWRSLYEQVDAAVQGVAPHPHQIQESGSVLEITRVLSADEADRAIAAAVDAGIARDGRAIVNTFLVAPALGALGAAVSPLGMSAYGAYEAKVSWDAGNKKTALALGALSALGLRASWGMPGRGVLSREAADLGAEYAPVLRGFGTPGPSAPLMGSPRSQLGAVGDLERLKPLGSSGADRIPQKVAVADDAIPYSARSFGEVLEAKYPGRVGSRTLPGAYQKNVGLAGTRHQTSRIVFDSRGFPIFDDVAVFDTRIAARYSSVENSGAHMRAATRDLREAIARGEVKTSQFTADQLRAIQGGKAYIPDLTWHHHQDIGRMQLIPFKVHQQTGHIGGYEMWFR